MKLLLSLFVIILSNAAMAAESGTRYECDIKNPTRTMGEASSVYVTVLKRTPNVAAFEFWLDEPTERVTALVTTTDNEVNFTYQDGQPFMNIKKLSGGPRAASWQGALAYKSHYRSNIQWLSVTCSSSPN